ncbi:MAG TPA: efflux RND transporter periplasmic adaptor subunit [Gemmatimonadaceae bacterium]
MTLRRLTIAVPATLAVAVAAWFLLRVPSAAADSAIIASAREGIFNVVVNTTGELRARKFVQVQGPANAQAAEIWQMKISTIVPEGTVVKEGEMVAELDRSQVASKLSEVNLALQKAEAQYTQAQLDSTMNLGQAREDLRNMEFTVEEKRIAKEQAQFEAPSIRRQAEIDFEKAQRALAQAKTNYVTKTQQARAKMSEVSADVERQRNRQQAVSAVMQAFTIKAPAPGMVIYAREWNGKKKAVGSTVSPWEPTVATLPDLTEMESVTYVNEVDVRKLAVGQPVTIGLDADPDKNLTGKVTSVANVGEQRPNQDSKVFEVKIAVAGSDTTLRPGMTTSNAILTASVAKALHVPLEALANENGVTFVYRRKGASVTKQEVEIGMMNDNQVVITQGLAKDDRVLLLAPADAAKLELVRLPGSEKRDALKKADSTARAKAAEDSAAKPAPMGDSAKPVAVPALPGAKDTTKPAKPAPAPAITRKS